MDTLKALVSKHLIARQIAVLNQRTGEQHRIVYPGQPFSCLDAVYVCRLRELVPELWDSYNIEVNENAIVVQECNAVNDENENVQLYAQWAYNIPDTVMDGLLESHIDARNTGNLDSVPNDILGMQFEIERRWFKPCRPKLWAHRFLQIARSMTRLHRVTRNKSIRFCDSGWNTGIHLQIEKNDRGRENVLRVLHLYPKWSAE